MTFEELYRTMLKQAVEKGSVQADDLEASAGHLDCLLHPQDHPLVWPLTPCTCPKEETHCAAACLFDAIVRRDDGTLAVDPDRCSGCGACIQACQSGNLTASRDVLPALDAVKHAKGPVYALIAPAFLGQFSTVVTPGRLRSAFKLLGFTKEQAWEQFGFLLEAFKYGVPPHAGLAYGMDRMVMLMVGADSIRDVIAFPKVKDASCLMMEAPSQVDPKQLEDLSIGVVESDEAEKTEE